MTCLFARVSTKATKHTFPFEAAPRLVFRPQISSRNSIRVFSLLCAAQRSPERLEAWNIRLPHDGHLRNHRSSVRACLLDSYLYRSNFRSLGANGTTEHRLRSPVRPPDASFLTSSLPRFYTRPFNPSITPCRTNASTHFQSIRVRRSPAETESRSRS